MQAIRLTVALEVATLTLACLAVSSSSVWSSKRARWPSYFLSLILPEYNVLGQPHLRLKQQDLDIGFSN
jgi:hypothetical protein